MGNRLKEIMPHTKRSSANPTTSSLLLSAKSTTRRIIYCSVASLLHRVLQRQRVRDNLIARFESTHHFLHVAGKHGPRHDFETLEMARPNRRVHPLPVMQVKNCGGGDGRMRFRLLPVEGRSNKHADTHQSRIRDF